MIDDVIDYIVELYPSAWLANLQREPDGYGAAGVDIQHPENEAFKLELIILKERVGIAVMRKSESECEIDLGGFDYSFESYEIESLKQFLRTFFKTAELEKAQK